MMMCGYTKDDAIQNMPETDNTDLLEAVIFAISLYLEQGETLKDSIDESAKLFEIKPKNSVEKVIRKAIPAEVILSRRYQKNKPSYEASTTHDSFFESMMERELDLISEKKTEA